MIFKILLSLFIASLSIGQVGGIMLRPGIVIYSHDFILPFVLFSGFIYLRKHRQTYAFLSIPIWLFVLAAIASLAVNAGSFNLDEILQASLYLVRWLLYASIYIVVVRSAISAYFWLRGLYLTGLLFALFGYLQFLFYPTLRNLYYLGWDEHYYRLFSTFFDPNYAGAFLILSLLLGLYLYSRSEQKMIYIGCELFLSVAILLTYSRGTLLSLIVSIGIWFYVKRKPIYGIIIGLCFVLLLSVLPTRGRDILSVFRAESALSRLGSWMQSLDLYREKPVFGFGFNTLRFVQTERGWASDEPFPSRSAAGVDSSILFLLITTGTVGFFSYIVLLIQQFGLAYSAMRGEYSVLGLSLLASLTSILVHSLFVNSLFYPWIMIWLWILTGAVERKITFRT